MLSIVPEAPVTSISKGPKSARSFGGHAGRKLKIAEADDGKEKYNRPADLADIEKILEKDSLDLMNMKKDLVQLQEAEVQKSQAQLNHIQREHDTLHVENNMKEKEYQNLLTSIKALNDVKEAGKETTGTANSKLAALKAEHSAIVEECDAEQRTLKMQELIAKRIDDEIVECKTESADLNFVVEHAKHELQVIDGMLRLSRQEIIEEERVLENMNQQIRSRREQREDKMGLLHSIVVEGENSVMKIQNSTMKSPSIHDDSEKFTKTVSWRSTPKQKLDEDYGETAGGADTETALTGKMLLDVIERYKSGSTRIQKLQSLDADIRQAIVEQKKRQDELTEDLQLTATKHQQLASSRQIYQEVDMKDAALSSARKECDECMEREDRLRINIESLRRAFPRFLTKITKLSHPIPTVDQLPDAVHKLEDEISKLIKNVDTAMLKDATPEDLATISLQATQSGGASDTNSEIGRLQKLPGYLRLQKQLFYNLMSAKPDDSDRNVRVFASETKKAMDYEGVTAPSTNLKKGDVGFASRGALDEVDDGEGVDETLDRFTIKSISRLVVERDRAKPISKAKSVS